MLAISILFQKLFGEITHEMIIKPNVQSVIPPEIVHKEDEILREKLLENVKNASVLFFKWHELKKKHSSSP